MKLTHLFTILFAASSTYLHATVTQIPGPEDQGGMVMPTVLISGHTLSYSWSAMGGGGMGWNPATDSVLMGTVGEWTDGDSFAPGTTYGNLLNPVSEGGQGNLFNTRYGFWVNGSSSALDANNYLVLRLDSISPGIIGWNNPASEVLTQVFSQAGDSVLWNGGMWHTLFTIAPDAAPGLYTASFQLLVGTVATSPVWSGFIDSTTNYTANSAYNTLTINYTWEVVPEPSVVSLAIVAVLGFVVIGRWKRSRQVVQH